MRTCLIALLVACPAFAEDWSRFRGPNGTGVSADTSIPTKWSKEDVLFRAEIPGSGHSSPIVVGKRVFLLSATDDARLVLCYDATGGKKLWEKSVGGEVGRTHAKSSLASSTPCSDGERLYCAFWDGKRVSLHAYDLEGKALWTKDLGRFTSQHGPGFSPVVVAGKVVINLDQDKSAVLLAFDAKTGNQLWKADRPAFRACYSTPFVIGEGKDLRLVVASTAGVSAYTLDGARSWNYAWTFAAAPLRTVGSPVGADGTIFACAGDGSGDRSMIAVRPDANGGTPALVWSKEKPKFTPYVPTLLAKDGHLYGVNDMGVALCFEAKSGEVLWQKPLSGPVSGSPVLIAGKVYATDEKGVCHVFAAETKGLRVLAKNDLGEAVFSTPAVADGRLYFRGSTHLICVGTKGK